MPTYRVRLLSTGLVNAEVEVEAPNREEAENVALDLGDHGQVDWTIEEFICDGIEEVEEEPEMRGMSSRARELEAQRQHIWGATLEQHLAELARRPLLARRLVAALHEVADAGPWTEGSENHLRCALALIRVRSLLEEEEY